MSKEEIYRAEHNRRMKRKTHNVEAERDIMLAALERIAKGGWHCVTPASSIAREAIAKAKGGAR